jgi:hypothetical protein
MIYIVTMKLIADGGSEALAFDGERCRANLAQRETVPALKEA